MKLTLASKSAARRAVLSGAGVPHDAVGADVDESVLKVEHLARDATPADVAMILAEAKSVAASGVISGLVLGADQTLDLDGELFDKAETLPEARVRLTQFRGRVHRLHSAVVLSQGGQVVWRHADQARLTMRDFSDAFLDAYLEAEGEALLSSVGCYRLEGLGAQLFERVEGDYFTILGMPLWPLLEELRRRGIVKS